MGRKALGAVAEFTVYCGPQILEGGEKVNQIILKRERSRRKKFNTKTSTFLAFRHSDYRHHQN
jgi:hypothetical protein